MKLIDSFYESSIFELSTQLNKYMLPIIQKLINGVYLFI